VRDVTPKIKNGKEEGGRERGGMAILREK
jgi:hypothetical protein